MRPKKFKIYEILTIKFKIYEMRDRGTLEQENDIWITLCRTEGARKHNALHNDIYKYKSLTQTKNFGTTSSLWRKSPQ